MYNPYNPKQLGACGSKKEGCPEGVEKYFVAMDSVEFDSASPVSYDNPYCHKCMMVTNPENGNSVTVYLTDSCVGCGANAIDISLQAMSDLVGGNNQAYKQGIIANAQWKHVPCPEILGAGEKKDPYTPPAAQGVESNEEEAAPLYSMPSEIQIESAYQEATPSEGAYTPPVEEEELRKEELRKMKYKSANANASINIDETDDTSDEMDNTEDTTGDSISTDETNDDGKYVETPAQVESGSLKIAIGLASLMSPLLF
jgi:hypothetical protein